MNTTQQVGGALGVSVLATIAAERTAGGAGAAALVDGYQVAFLVAAGLRAGRGGRGARRAARAPRVRARSREAAVAAG